MGYKKIVLILISSVLLCGCTNEIAQTEVPPESYTTEDVAEQTGDEQTGDEKASVYAYSDKTVIDTINDGGLVYRAEKDETIIGAAGSSDMLFVLTYRDNVLTGNGQAEHMPFTLIGMNKNGSILEPVFWEDGFIMAGAELEMADPEAYLQMSQDMFSSSEGISDIPSALFEDTILNAMDAGLPLGAGREIDSFPASISGELLGYYQGKLYMVYHTYEEDGSARQRYAYCYEQQPDGSFEKSQDALCMTIMDLYDQGYLFCGDAKDLFAGLNAYDRLLAWKQEEAKVCAIAVDGSILWEKQIDPKIINIKGTDGRLLFGVGYAEDADGWYYFIYDLEGAFADGSDVKEGTYAWSDGSYLDMRDGYLYYYRYNKTAYNRNQYYFYRCNLYDADAEEELLYETQDVAGQPQQREGNNGAAGFTVQGNACYFMDFDGESLWWFACDLSDDANTLTRLDVVDEYHGIFDAGEIMYATDSYRCSNCGELVYEYYLEGIRLNGDEEPVMDQINEALAEETDGSLESMEERIQIYQNRGTDGEHVCGSYTFRTTLERRVDGVTQYRFHKEGQEGELTCLEADYSGYDYSGGVHGYPWRSHFFFDLSDGSEISMADVIGVDEEEFRALAAEYTVEDYLGENGNLYFEVEEDALYDTVYQYAGFDCEMYLGADGVVVEYSPYFLGAYGSGYIEVTIPYEELGLELVEIYGVNE